MCAPPLADELRELEVRAVDVYLSTDSTPASATFTVDTTGPTTRLDEVAAARSNDTTPSFAWSSADADRESFECNLDRTDSAEPSPWEACGTEDTFGPLGDGAWTFQVRGVDDLGNRGVPASHDFVIDTEGVIRYAEVLESAGDEPDYSSIRETLARPA